MTLPVILGFRIYPAAGSELFIRQILEELKNDVMGVVATVGNKPWNGPIHPEDQTIPYIKQVYPSTYIVRQAWANENDQGNELLRQVRNNFPQATHMLLIDADEFYLKEHVNAAYRYAVSQNADALYIGQKIYWKSIYYKLPPDFLVQALSLIKLNSSHAAMERLRHIRDSGRKVWFPQDQGFCHHYSYVRTDEQMKQKLGSFSHVNDIKKDWYTNVWEKWNQNKNLANLHPVDPSLWPKAISISESEIPSTILKYQADVPNLRP